jgi:hypothetical protein
MIIRLARSSYVFLLVALVAVLTPKAVWGQTKLDESLRESLARGCTGTHSVIIP